MEEKNINLLSDLYEDMLEFKQMLLNIPSRFNLSESDMNNLKGVIDWCDCYIYTYKMYFLN